MSSGESPHSLTSLADDIGSLIMDFFSSENLSKISLTSSKIRNFADQSLAKRRTLYVESNNYSLAKKVQCLRKISKSCPKVNNLQGMTFTIGSSSQTGFDLCLLQKFKCASSLTHLSVSASTTPLRESMRDNAHSFISSAYFPQLRHIDIFLDHESALPHIFQWLTRFERLETVTVTVRMEFGGEFSRCLETWDTTSLREFCKHSQSLRLIEVILQGIMIEFDTTERLPRLPPHVQTIADWLAEFVFRHSSSLATNMRTPIKEIRVRLLSSFFTKLNVERAQAWHAENYNELARVCDKNPTVDAQCNVKMSRETMQTDFVVDMWTRKQKLRSVTQVCGF